MMCLPGVVRCGDAGRATSGGGETIPAEVGREWYRVHRYEFPPVNSLSMPSSCEGTKELRALSVTGIDLTPGSRNSVGRTSSTPHTTGDVRDIPQTVPDRYRRGRHSVGRRAHLLRPGRISLGRNL
ncbi:hypothetical protein GCM10009612_65090 [Streptomyces beijiangensis]